MRPGLRRKGRRVRDALLSDEQLDRLAAAIEEGPAAYDWVEDQRWTLRGVSLLLHRIGFSPQIPKHRAVERDEDKIFTWRREAQAQAKS